MQKIADIVKELDNQNVGHPYAPERRVLETLFEESKEFGGVKTDDGYMLSFSAIYYPRPTLAIRKVVPETMNSVIVSEFLIDVHEYVAIAAVGCSENSVDAVADGLLSVCKWLVATAIVYFLKGEKDEKSETL